MTRYPNINAERARRGLSTAQLAKMLGVTRKLYTTGYLKVISHRVNWKKWLHFLIAPLIIF